MASLDDLFKLGDFPAVRAYREKHWHGWVLNVDDTLHAADDAIEELAEELVEMSKALDAAISDAKYFERERDEARRKRRKAQRLADKLTKALTQIERHPNSKLDDVAAAYFALGEEAARAKLAERDSECGERFFAFNAWLDEREEEDAAG